MGLSTDKASTIPLVLNLDTGAITPQFHVVFDDCSLQLPPVLMISQTLTLQHGPRYLKTVSTNSSGMKMTPRLTKKTPLSQKTSPPSNPEYQDHGQHHASLTLASISSSIFTFHAFPPSLPCTVLHVSQLSSHCCAFTFNWYVTSSSAPEGENTLASATATEEPSRTENTHSPQLQQQREPIFTNSLAIPPDMQAKIHVEHGPLHEVMCLYCRTGFD